MAWAGIIDNTIIGPFFFDENVTGDTYVEMLVDHVLPEIHRKGLSSHDICYMHDGAPAHITRDVRRCLDDNFLHWIGRFDGENKLLDWPPRSPDLNMIDFFLWGVLQHRVHIHDTDSIDDLTNEIVNEVNEANEIPPDMLERVQVHLLKRLRKCILEEGELFEHLLK